MCPYTVPDKALLRLTAHPAKRRAPPQPDVRPPLRSIGHRTRIQQARHKRGRSAPACGLGHRPGLAGTRKGYPFLLCTPLHRHADVRLCCAGKRPKGARSPIFGHTRVSIALFRQICNLIPAQNLLTHSIKYGQTHRQKMSLPLLAIKNTTRLGGVFGRGRKARTLDTRFWRPLLYQLSYTPMWWAFGDSNPGPDGYEPSALTN